MLKMELINEIKRLREEQGMSINKIAKTLKLNWRTVKKYADSDWSAKIELNKPKSGMLYDPELEWGKWLSSWLAEDAAKKMRERRSRKLYFEDLVARGFPGSYRTVCNYVEEWLSENHESI